MASKLDFSALKNGKKMSKRDINFILAGVAFIILIAAYMLGFQNLTTKSDELAKSLDEKEKYLVELKGYFENLATYEEGTSASKMKIKSNLDRLPVGFENEDFLLWLMHNNEKIGSSMSAVSFNAVNEVAKFNTYVDGKYKEVTGYSASGTATLSMNYSQFKDYLELIYDPTADFAYVDNAALTYNSEDGELNTILNINKFFITYDGGVYQGEEGYDVPFGTANPFGGK